jgi:hypothetical protein
VSPSPLRRLVGELERELTPPLKQLLSSEGFAQLTGAATRVEGSVRRSIDDMTTRVWHLVNLPTATDLQRVRVLVAELDQQLRQLQRAVDRREDGPHP